MKLFLIHARTLVLPGGKVRTACGQVVPEAQASSDWREVNCESKGCVAAADEGKEQYVKAMSVKWW